MADLESTSWPLHGIRVIDMTQNVAGPYGAMILADMGASVIKIEPPSGDACRSWGPPFWEGQSATYLALNRNKTGDVLDIKSKDGLAALHQKLETADVLLFSARTGAMDRYGLGYECLHEKYPMLIYGEVTAYGHYGPRINEPGYDPLMQAMAGIMSVTGRGGEDPVRVGTSIVDMGTGMWLAIGIMGALRMRDQTGVGSRVVTALFETAVSWMTIHAHSYWASGQVPRAWGSGMGMIVPYEAFPTADDGKWIIIAAGNDHLFRKLGSVLGHPEWSEDSRFSTNPSRVSNRADLTEMMRSITRTFVLETLMEKLISAGIPVAEVASLDQVMANPQLLASDLMQEIDHPDISDYRSIGIPLKINGRRPPLRQWPPFRADSGSDSSQ